MPEGEPPDGMTGAGEMAESAEVEIEGMSCGACVSAVEQALARLPAGSVVRSHVEVGLAKLEFRPDLVNVAAVIEGALSGDKKGPNPPDNPIMTPTRQTRVLLPTFAAIEDCGFDARLRQPTSAEVPLAPVKEDGPTLAPKAAENGPRRVMVRGLPSCASLIDLVRVSSVTFHTRRDVGSRPSDPAALRAGDGVQQLRRLGDGRHREGGRLAGASSLPPSRQK